MTETSSVLDVPDDWQRSAERIRGKRWRRILVIGATDRGKSSYCQFLLQALISAGARVGFVDADIGQKDVGPPATISLAYPRKETALSQAPLAGLYFVGAVAPGGHLLPITVGTRRLVDAARTSTVVVDTPGMIHGSGRVLTGYQIESLRPDVIVALERDRELRSLLGGYGYCNIIRLKPSPEAKGKSREDRQASRERAFRAYFQDAREISLELKSLSVQRSLLFTGKPIDDPRFLYAEQTPEGVVAVGESSQEGAGVQTVPSGFEKNLLCGLADRRGNGLGLALIRGIDFARRIISLLTPVSDEPVRVLQFGELYLRPDGKELGRRPPGTF